MENDTKTTVKSTPKYIRKLSCPKHLKQFYECVLPDVHLYLSIGRGGTKSFTFRRKVDGCWKTLDLECKFIDSLSDTHSRLTIDKAKEKSAELTARASRGEDVFTKAKDRRVEPTLKHLFEHYRQGHLEKKAKRVNDAVNDFARWFSKVANRRVSTFTHEHANQIHERMKDTPYSANRAMQLGRAMFNFAIKTKMISSDNPFDNISPYEETPRERFLSDEEAGRLLSYIESVPLEHSVARTLADFILLDLMTASRKMNLLSMRFDEISEADENCWTWTIPASKMKTSNTQRIPLGKTEIEALKRRKQSLKDAGIDSPWVFPSTKSESGHLVDIGNSWETLRERLNLADCTLHDLRRSLASAMANSGANVALVQGALNHGDVRTTLKAYIRTTQQAQLEARQKAQQGWFNAAREAEPVS